MRIYRAVVACIFAILAASYDIAPITPQMRADADALIVYGHGERTCYNRLAYLTDTFGPRFSGTQPLEDALSYVVATAKSDPNLVVTEQPINITRWVRGAEYATMKTPRVKSLHFIGLGMSNATFGPDGNRGPVTAPVMVVHNVSEFNARSAEVAGKIVLFNVAFTSYGGTVGIRSAAAGLVAQYGGVGALIRAVGPYGIQTPHTGGSDVAAVAAGAGACERFTCTRVV